MQDKQLFLVLSTLSYHSSFYVTADNLASASIIASRIVEFIDERAKVISIQEGKIALLNMEENDV